jgi:hypothetical protein
MVIFQSYVSLPEGKNVLTGAFYVGLLDGLGMGVAGMIIYY